MRVDRFADTIAAVITPPGRGAVAIIRLSGPEAIPVARKVASFLPKNPEYRHAYYGRFSHGDDGICIVFASGASFTGEPVAEFNIHGSPESVKQLLELCYQCGARPAEAGEFSMRAFMNGQIDLAQAEGIRATVDSFTDRQLKSAHALRDGVIGHELAPITDNIRKALTTVEALTDFSEELGEIPLQEKTEPLYNALSKVNDFLALEGVARRIREGALVVIAGQPNVGKSSLMNALLKYERAIVTSIAGTTRDSIEEQIALNGIPVRLVDTAGLRNTSDEVEKLGIDRSKNLLDQADIVLYLVDSSQGRDGEDEATLKAYSDKVIEVSNKCDLTRLEFGYPISTLTGEGLSELIAIVTERLQAPETDSPLTLIDRHYEMMREVKSLVQESITALERTDMPDDLAAVTLRAALRKIGELTGESAPADVLEQIFSQFCIGK